MLSLTPTTVGLVWLEEDCVSIYPDAWGMQRAAHGRYRKSSWNPEDWSLLINLNVQGCGIVATPMHAPSRTPLLLPLLLSHNPTIPSVH
jgi:hypothetical protein